MLVGRDDGLFEVYGYNDMDEPVLKFSHVSTVRVCLSTYLSESLSVWQTRRAFGRKNSAPALLNRGETSQPGLSQNNGCKTLLQHSSLEEKPANLGYHGIMVVKLCSSTPH
jgi:hypothetical protein